MNKGKETTSTSIYQELKNLISTGLADIKKIIRTGVQQAEMKSMKFR